jgi:peptidyl-prolyl cis-trans isomerase C
MQKLRTICGALVLAGVLAACGQPATGDQAVMARVGSGVITNGDLQRVLQPGADPNQALDQLIDVELVIQAARREGAGVDPAAVDEQITQLRDSQGGGTEEGLNAFLQQNGIDSTEQLREVLVRQQLIDKMVLTHSTLEQARASHILVAADDDAQKAIRKPEADALLEQVQAGADFAALAQEKSEDPGSAQQGGDLGWQPRGLFVPEFDEAIFSMKKGELRLVETQFGWHIIRLDEEAQVRGFDNPEQLSTPAGQQAFQQTFLPWVQELRAEAERTNAIDIVGDPTTVTPPAPPAAPQGQPADPNAPQGQPAEPAPTTAP